MYDDIRFEIRLNGVLDEGTSNVHFMHSNSNRPFFVILDESEVPGLRSRFLKVYTADGFDVRLSKDALDSFVEVSMDTLKNFISNPSAFVPKQETQDSFVLSALVDYPHILDSKIVETGSISGYRYELHTECESEPGIIHALLVFSPHDSEPCMAIVLDADSHLFRLLTAKTRPWGVVVIWLRWVHFMRQRFRK